MTDISDSCYGEKIRTCAECKYFVQHYVKVGTEFVAAEFCGSCAKHDENFFVNISGAKMACSDWEEFVKSDVNADYIKKCMVEVFELRTRVDEMLYLLREIEYKRNNAD